MTTRRSHKPELTSDFQRRNWSVVDVFARVERAAIAQDAQPAHRGSAA